MILRAKFRTPCKACKRRIAIGEKVSHKPGVGGYTHLDCTVESKVENQSGYAPRTSVKLPEGAMRCGHTVEGPDFKTDGSIILQCVKVQHNIGACIFVNWSMIGEDSPEEKRWAKHSKALEIKGRGDS